MATKANPSGSAQDPKPAPAKKTMPAKAAKAAPAKATNATTAKVEGSQTASAEPATGDADAEQAPMNRAERRAKGRGKTASQVPGARGKVTGSHGPSHTQRNWANRRTG
jgi:hypothetical protein